MKSIYLTTLFCISSLTATQSLMAQTTTDWSQLTTKLESKMTLAKVPALQMVLNQSGKTVYAAEIGTANKSTLFFSASMTKMLTAVAVLQLSERGLVELNQPLVKYLPWLGLNPAPQARQMTVAQVLSHTSGMSRNGISFWSEPSRWGGNESPSEDEVKAAAILQIFGTMPGERLKYSNLGYEILGLLVGSICDQCSGSSTTERYINYVSENILKPLKMHRSGFIPSASERSEFAIPYSRKDSQGLRQPFPLIKHGGAAVAAWGLYSDATEFTRFMEEIAKVIRREKNSLFKNDMSDLIAQPVAWDLANPALGHSLGFRIWKTNKGLLVGHSGTFPGYSGASFVSVADGTVGTVYLNTIDAGGVGYLMEAFGFATGEKLVSEASQIPAPLLPPVMPNNPFSAVVGKYTVIYEDLEVVYENEMYFLVQGGVKLPLYINTSSNGRVISGRIGVNAGYFAFVGDSVQFEIDGHGQVQRVSFANSIIGYPVQ